MKIEARELSFSYGAEPVLAGVDLAFPAGQLSVLVGANGCGKSTLLNLLAGGLKPSGGEVRLGGQPLASYQRAAKARALALLPQTPHAYAELTVFELVRLGRYPHQTLLQQWSAEDQRQVEQALERTGLAAQRDKPLTALSGGQRQRAWIALVLAQDAEVLLLDEPINHLDLHHQIEVLDLMTELVTGAGKTLVTVLHDINLACRYGQYLVALKNGAVHAAGAPRQIVDAALIRAVLGVETLVLQDPLYHTPLCLPLSQVLPLKGNQYEDHATALLRRAAAVAGGD
jgi:iron complex transport system ATP-binding protein